MTQIRRAAIQMILAAVLLAATAAGALLPRLSYRYADCGPRGCGAWDTFSMTVVE